MTPLEQAYLEWVKFAPYKTRVPERVVGYTSDKRGEREFVEVPHWDGHCCQSGHYYRDNSSGMMIEREKEDFDVCPRERAWRKYCRLRDGVPAPETKH